jgi:UDP-N-acetylglucosamine 2-epimerase
MSSKLFKVMSVVGARPQFIKLAGLHRAISKEKSLEHIIVHSGQHYDHNMSGQFFVELNIPEPYYNIGIGSGHHNVQIAKCIVGVDEILEKEMPDLVIVYGDTNTTSAAAMAASKRNVPIAHIEAGLREFDKSIPEEVNKLITDSVTDLYFTPTETGRINLANEGKCSNVFVTGDISLDLLFDFVINDEFLKKYNVRTGDYYFLTCHRAANTDVVENLGQILRAIENLDKVVLWPMHPRTGKVIEASFPNWSPANVKIIDTCGFLETQTLIKQAAFVITDSGGIIKEAYFHKVPAVIIDKQTEWIETVDEGWNTIAGPNANKILEAVKNWRKPRRHGNCIGNGNAGKVIVKEILNYLNVAQ